MPSDSEGAHGSYDTEGTRHGPDPTVLTTEQLLRAISSERDYTNGQLEVLRERLTGIDKATELRLGGIVGIPEQIDEKVNNLESLMEEKFQTVSNQFTNLESLISNQFKERDTRSERETRDNKLTVDAAFAAQEKLGVAAALANEKAIDKSELSTTETINKLAQLMDASAKATIDKIDDVKEGVAALERRIGDRLSAIELRVGSMESIKQGGKEAYAGLYVMAGLIVSVIVALVAVGVFKK